MSIIMPHFHRLKTDSRSWQCMTKWGRKFPMHTAFERKEEISPLRPSVLRSK